MCDIKKMNVDVLESMLTNLNKDYTQLKKDSKNIIKQLKYDAAFERSKANENKECINLMNDKITSLQATILSYQTEIEDKEMKNKELRHEVRKLENEANHLLEKKEEREIEYGNMLEEFKHLEEKHNQVVKDLQKKVSQRILAVEE